MILTLLATACSYGGARRSPAPTARPTATGASPSIARATPAPRWTDVDDFVYQLQDVDLTAMGRSTFDLAIIDPSRDGSDETRFTAGQIAALKGGRGGPKLVLAYLSIGEAEDYRGYWRRAWDRDRDGRHGGPSWLGPANPDWPGNYKVRYWEAGWRSILFGSPASSLDRIIAAGFDGVYLDIIDAFEYWGPGGESGLERASAEREMVRLVLDLARYARSREPSFGIFPQNGEALSSDPEYVAVVDGIGREDVWYDADAPQPSPDVRDALASLDVFRKAGKLVMVIDYVRRAKLIDDFYGKARARGYVPYATVRDLDRLTINPGHAPD